jgi:hypothetical protein
LSDFKEKIKTITAAVNDLPEENKGHVSEAVQRKEIKKFQLRKDRQGNVNFVYAWKAGEAGTIVLANNVRTQDGFTVYVEWVRFLRGYFRTFLLILREVGSLLMY